MSANLDNGVMLGALGSAHTDGTTPISPPTNMVIVAIQMISKNTIVSLVAEEPTRFFNTVTAAHNAGTISFKVQDKWTDLLQLVLITVIGAYFGGRSLEKVKK